MRSSIVLVDWNASQPKEANIDHPWERQPFDTDVQWAAFREYLMLPLPRTVEALAEKTGLHPGKLQRWAQKGCWVIRTNSLDDYVHDKFQERVESYVETRAQDYVERHTSVLRKGFDLLDRELDKYLELSRAGDAVGVPTLPPQHLIRLLEQVVKLERLTHGDTTEKVELDFDMTKYTLDELKNLKELQQKGRK
jgi:hypothetical protein